MFGVDQNSSKIKKFLYLFLFLFKQQLINKKSYNKGERGEEKNSTKICIKIFNLLNNQ